MTRIKDLPTLETLDSTNWIAVDSNDDLEPSGKANPTTLSAFVNFDLAPVLSLAEGVGISISGDPQNPTISSTGSGVGDMLSAIYDPQNISSDAFSRENHTGEQPISATTGLQDALDSPVDEPKLTRRLSARVGGLFDTVSDLLADTTLTYSNVSEGDIIEAQGFRYEVAASAATDHDVETSGGVKLYALPKKHWGASINVLALGADPTGVTSSQEAFEKAIAGWGYITGPGGNYVFTDTIIVGNRKNIVFPGAWQTQFWLGKSYSGYTGEDDFPNSPDYKPLFALSPNYLDPGPGFLINQFRGEGFTIRDNPATDANGLVTASQGPGGIDVSGTKDDIRLVDVFFRNMVHGCFKRDRADGGTPHWGFHVEGGGAQNCRWAYQVYPNVGSIRDADIRNCIYGLDVSSTNNFSCTMWLEGLRVEIDQSYAPPSTQRHVRLQSVRANISGYFEGGRRHIEILGGEHSQTTIGPACRFSTVHKDGVIGVLGTPIYYGATSTLSTLTLLGLDGKTAANQEAFIQLPANAAGTINWFGQGGTFGNFIDAAGVVQNFPPETLNIDYFNTHRVRGLIRTSNDFEFRDGATNAISGRIEAEAGSTKFYFTDTRWLSGGAGSPEGAVTAPVGCIYIDSSSAVMWRKTSGTGNTGWTQVPLA